MFNYCIFNWQNVPLIVEEKLTLIFLDEGMMVLVKLVKSYVAVLIVLLEFSRIFSF